MKSSAVKNGILISFLCTIVFSTTTFSQSDKNFAFAARGKVIGFFILEDTYFATATAGGELIFKGKHSLGIDATWFRWRGEEDDSKDVGMYENYERRTYLYFDYKYKFAPTEKHVSSKKWEWYLNLYDKNGKYKMWYSANRYDFSNIDTSFLRSNTKGIFNEVGIGIGSKIYFNDYGEKYGFGLDCSANVAKRFSTNDIQQVDSSVTVFSNDVRQQKFLFYMRLNLFYRFR